MISGNLQGECTENFEMNITEGDLFFKKKRMMLPKNISGLLQGYGRKEDEEIDTAAALRGGKKFFGIGREFVNRLTWARSHLVHTQQKVIRMVARKSLR